MSTGVTEGEIGTANVGMGVSDKRTSTGFPQAVRKARKTNQKYLYRVGLFFTRSLPLFETG
jgi:hypothetical protein